MRTLLLLGMLVPLLGATLVAGTAARERHQVRAASLALQSRAADLALHTQLASALATEETHSRVLALATRYEEEGQTLDLDLDLTRARLAGARALVDSDRFDRLRAGAGLDAPLQRLRHRLDLGAADHDGVSTFFRATDLTIEAAWEVAMREVDRSADQEALPKELRSRLRSLRGTMSAFSVARDRVEHTLDLFLVPPTATRTRLLIDASARFDAGLETAMQTASPRLADMWARWDAAPATERTEDLMDRAERIGLGAEPPVPAVDLAALAQGLDDGARWAILLTDMVRTAAVDLEDAASAHAHSAERAMAAQLAGMGALVAVSLAVSAVVARSITTPVRRLEGAVRQVEAGQFQLRPLPERGPRELAATARAFNDMAGTLAGVEGHALALAGHPAAPVVQDVLPGRTGEAMQAALDRLRASVAEAEARRAELAELASRDGLTGLLNRGAAIEALERDLARTRREGSTLLALYVDLDGLKEINDTHGHAAGDEAIRRTAAALGSSTRAGDVVARLGGDEFLVVGPYPPGGQADAEALAGRVRDAVRAQAVRVRPDSEVPLRCSVGAARSGPATATVDDLIRSADLALYEAKGAGRDRVVWRVEPTDRADQTV